MLLNPSRMILSPAQKDALKKFRIAKARVERGSGNSKASRTAWFKAMDDMGRAEIKFNKLTGKHLIAHKKGM